MLGPKLILGLVLGILLVVSPASGIKVPELSQVPKDISSPAREELLRQRSELEGQWEVLSAKVEEHNQKCRRIPSDSPLARECREAMARLHGDINIHVDSAKKFNEDVKWALKWKALEKEIVVQFLSEKEEIRVGREMAGHLEKQMILMTDPQVNHYLQMLLRRLATRSTRPALPYTVKVVKDDAINAFALPGGHIYLNDGLIRAATSESELASVLAHEIAHSAARHHAKEISKIAHSVGASIVGGILTGPATGFGLLSQQMIQEGAYLKFTRDEEREADRLAVEMLYQAGIKPTGLTSFFERLRRKQTEKEGLWSRFYSTHPSPEERKENLAPLFADPRFNQIKQVDSADFQNIRAKF